MCSAQGALAGWLELRPVQVGVFWGILCRGCPGDLTETDAGMGWGFLVGYSGRLLDLKQTSARTFWYFVSRVP